MNANSRILENLATKMLKAAEVSEKFNKQMQRSEKLHKLKSTLTEKYKFIVETGAADHRRHAVERDVSRVKALLSKVSFSPEDELTLEELCKRYGIS